MDSSHIPKAREDMRWHVQGVGNPRSDGTVAPGGRQSALGECWIIVAVDQIVGDAGMLRIFLPQFFQETSRLQLIGQRRVGGCCVANCQ
jgi:hypothetical protein